MLAANDARRRAEQLAASGELEDAVRTLMGLGQHDRALELVQERVASAPSDVRLLLLKGQVLLGRGAPEEAAEAFRAACRRGDSSGEAHFELARSLALLGELDAALHHFGECLHLNPGNLDAYEAIAELLWAMDKPNAALEFLRRAALEVPAPELTALLARAAIVADEPELASAAIQQLGEEEPPSARRSLLLGGLYLALGELEEARSEYEAALEREPDQAEPHHALATVHLEAGRRDEAAATYRAALEQDASYWPSLNDLGLLLLSQSQAEQALPLLRRAVALRPEEPASQLNLALALLAAGARGAARQHARAAMSLARDGELLQQATDLVRQLT